MTHSACSAVHAHKTMDSATLKELHRERMERRGDSVLAPAADGAAKSGAAEPSPAAAVPPAVPSPQPVPPPAAVPHPALDVCREVCRTLCQCTQRLGSLRCESVLRTVWGCCPKHCSALPAVAALGILTSTSCCPLFLCHQHPAEFSLSVYSLPVCLSVCLSFLLLLCRERPVFLSVVCIYSLFTRPPLPSPHRNWTAACV